MSGASAGTPGVAVDPTKNVLDLVAAESKFQNAMREASDKFQNGMREAESRRQDDLAGLKRYYDKQISDILTVQVKTTSELISTQLDKVTTSLSNQITSLTKDSSDRIAAVAAALGERTGQLERFRWEVGGKTGGRSDMFGWIFGGLMFLVSLISPVVLLLSLKGHP